MGHIDVEIWHRWVPPVNRRGRSTLGLDDSVRVSERDSACENGPLSILRHGAQFFLLSSGWNLVRRGCAAHRTAIRQSNGERTRQSSPVKNQGRFPREETRESYRVQTSGGRALAQTLCARSGPVPRASSSARVREHDFALVPGRNLGLDLGPRGFDLGRGCWPTLATRATRPRDTGHARPQGRNADRRQTASRGKRSAGMLEMSRRVGGAESRCQAQSVRSCAGLGLAGWGPRPVLLFLL